MIHVTNNTGVSFGAIHIPKRKKPIVARFVNGEPDKKYGFFDSDEKAEAFCNDLTRWLNDKRRKQ